MAKNFGITLFFELIILFFFTFSCSKSSGSVNEDIQSNTSSDDPDNGRVSIQLEKVGHFSDFDENGIVNEGDEIEYSFILRNTGEVDLTEIKVKDPIAVVEGKPIRLAPGESADDHFKGIYKIKEADIARGGVYNLAKVTARTEKGEVIEEESYDPNGLSPGEPNYNPDCPKCTYTSLSDIDLDTLTDFSLHPSIPQLKIPEGIGVNIHFTQPKAGEMEMLSDAGFKWVRMDLFWNQIETVKGKYNFSKHEYLLARLKEKNIKPIFILDWGNALYDEFFPETEEGIQAFADWAAATVNHFKGNGILWEVFNEPNHVGYWKPNPSAKKYIKLALATGKAIKKVAPKEAIIGPAASRFPFEFLDSCFDAGLLNYFDAVSVHPYRLEEGPESVTEDYQRLKNLIEKYAPPGREIPVISGEWGYTTSHPATMNEDLQGAYASRSLLINLLNEIPLSIWYDWHDDGEDPSNWEHNFGTVYFDYFSTETPVYHPKPAYKAIKALTSLLDGFSFERRLPLSTSDDYFLQFTKGGENRRVIWTSEEKHLVNISLPKGTYKLISFDNEMIRKITSDAEIEIEITRFPIYIIEE